MSVTRLLSIILEIAGCSLLKIYLLAKTYAFCFVIVVFCLISLVVCLLPFLAYFLFYLHISPKCVGFVLVVDTVSLSLTSRFTHLLVNSVMFYLCFPLCLILQHFFHVLNLLALSLAPFSFGFCSIICNLLMRLRLSYFYYLSLPSHFLWYPFICFP